MLSITVYMHICYNLYVFFLNHPSYCKNFNNTQVRFPTDPYNALVYSPRISSNRREWNSAPPLQFVTPGRELIQKSTKSTNFKHFLTLKATNFRNRSVIRDLKPVNLKNQHRKTWISSTSNALIDPCLSPPIREVHFRISHYAPAFRSIILCTPVLSRSYPSFNQMHSMTLCQHHHKPTLTTYGEHLLMHSFILQTDCDRFWQKYLSARHRWNCYN